jgi:creatinine amidohydrolase
MNLREAETRLAAEPVVLIPFGAQEAHGPHLPLGADYLVAEEVAVRASRLTNAVVAPTMPYGYAGAFRGFAGNVSTRPEITQMLAEDIITDLAAAGPTHFILVDNHAGNDTALEVAARSLKDRLGVSIGHFYPWKVMTVWGPELFGDQWKAVFGHGAEPNTSVMLYLTPENVDMTQAVPGALASFGGRRMASSRYVEIEGVQHQIYIDTKRINDSSVTAGDPRIRPDPTLGRVFVERCAQSLAQFVEWFRTQKTGGVRS